ncbi:MAG: hypothetical protein ACTHMS_03055 [Jatrophihabitans sp.]|uniref:hypothetical protein n=1 Tax=Jatrophihabitans sp. TaxID=1932789 RepID=UPI003F7CEA2E
MAIVLVVEDVVPHRTAIEAALASCGHRTVSADTAAAAMQLLGDARPDLVVAEITAACADAIALAALRRLDDRRRIPVVYYTGEYVGRCRPRPRPVAAPAVPGGSPRGFGDLVDAVQDALCA